MYIANIVLIIWVNSKQVKITADGFYHLYLVKPAVPAFKAFTAVVIKLFMIGKIEL